MKTIRQIADELGVDKQRVYRYIQKHHISDVHHDAGVMHIDDALESRLIKHFAERDHINDAHQSASEPHQTASLDAVISMLQKELEIKNEQIRDLSAALVAAQQTAQAAQALHAGTVKQLSDGKKGLARFFGRNKHEQ